MQAQRELMQKEFAKRDEQQKVQGESLQATLTQITASLQALHVAPGPGASSSSGARPSSIPKESEGVLDEMGLGNLPALSGRKGQARSRRSVTFHQDGLATGAGDEDAGNADNKTDEILERLVATQELQLKL